MSAEKGILEGETLSNESMEQMRRFGYAARETLQKYNAAMRQMEVRLEILDENMKLKQHRSPIHHIESRLKSPESIIEKMGRYGIDISLDNMTANITDVAGVRVICSYIQDVYGLYERLERQDDLTIINVKDYISNPKPNGYRSLHIIATMPVYLLDEKEDIPVEIQVRTVAMDFWASLEHDLKYKAVRELNGIDSVDELRECSRIIEDVEARMQILARALQTE